MPLLPRKVRFGPFLMDPPNERLTREGEERPLTPKAWAVLAYLVERAGNLVTKREIMDRVWADAVVGDAVLKVAVREIRKALDDATQDPQFIQTHHRRGYRFVAPVEAVGVDVPALVLAESDANPADRAAPRLRGREAILEPLREAWREARGGNRRVVVLRGDAGIGKTAILEAFDREVGGRALVLFGSCAESLGEPEDLYPLYEAIGTQLVGDPKNQVRELLMRYAPTAVAQIPALREESADSSAEVDPLGFSPARLRREVADFIEAVARNHPLVWIVDGLQWLDAVTADVMSLIIRRRQRSPILILGAYRSQSENSPLARLRAALEADGLLAEVEVGPLDDPACLDVAEAWAPGAWKREALHAVVARSGGHPLFLSQILRDLEGARRGGKGRGDLPKGWLETLPDTLRRMIMARIQRVPESGRRVLEAGSVAAAAGTCFSAVSAAAALGVAADSLTGACDALLQQGAFLTEVDPVVFADDVRTKGYRFCQAFVQEVLYESLSSSQRARFHEGIVRAGERLFSDRRDQVVHEFAFHYERSHQWQPAVDGWIRAGLVAMGQRRFADAARFFGRAQSLEKVHPTSSGRASLELGRLRRMTGDMVGARADLKVAGALARAAGESGILVEALLLECSAGFWEAPAEARGMAERAVQMAQELGDENAAQRARAYCDHAQLLTEPDRLDDPQGPSESDLVADLFTRNRIVWRHALRGTYREGQELTEILLPLNQAQGDAFESLLVLFWGGWCALHRGDWRRLNIWLDEADRLATTHQHVPWTLGFWVLRAHLCLSMEAWEEATDLLAEVGRLATSLEAKGQVLSYAQWVGLRVKVLAPDAGPEVAKLRPDPTSIEWIDPVFEPLRALAWAEWARGLGDAARAEAFSKDLVQRARRRGVRDYEALGLGILASTHPTVAKRKSLWAEAYRTASDPDPLWPAIQALGRWDGSPAAQRRAQQASDRLHGSV